MTAELAQAAAPSTAAREPMAYELMGNALREQLAAAAHNTSPRRDGGRCLLPDAGSSVSSDRLLWRFARGGGRVQVLEHDAEVLGAVVVAHVHEPRHPVVREFPSAAKKTTLPRGPW